jgi:hypothetical protein
MHNMKFGQIHCVDLLKKIHTKFTLYFSSISTNFYLILKLGIFKLIIEFRKEKLLYSTGSKSDPRPWPSRGGGLLWVTGRNSRVNRGVWPSPRPEWPGGSCRLGKLVCAHGRSHRTQDRRGGVAGAAHRWRTGRQGPCESIIKGRASRRARKQGGELATGVAQR